MFSSLILRHYTNLSTMKRFYFRHAIITVAFALGIATQVFCQTPGVDTLNISITPVFGGGDDIPHLPHKSPENVSLPSCLFDGYTLLFIGTGEVSLTYSVVDEYEYEWVRGTLSLSNGDEEPVDVSTLPAGTYTLILGIAGREYEGVFEIE